MDTRRIERPGARVLPVDRGGRVLLLQGRDPARPDHLYWFTIGGGLEPGDTPATAAVRELREETGITITIGDLVGPFHRGSHTYSYNGERYRSVSVFFAVRLDDVAVTFDGLDPSEVGNIVAAGWWHPDDLSDLTLSNPGLPDIACRAVAAVTEK